MPRVFSLAPQWAWAAVALLVVGGIIPLTPLFRRPKGQSPGAANLPAANPGTAFDLLILNGLVVDGSGKPGFRADIGIRNGRIAAVGSLGNAKAPQKVDAKGLAVAPGFIDAHTNIESQVALAKRRFIADNFVLQGVTTVITGNCGRSAPDIESFFQKLSNLQLPLNVATLVGHNTIRQIVCGSRPVPTPAEMARMQHMVGEALDAGALGFSTGLCYWPGLFSSQPEVAALVRVAAQRGAIYATHIRDEGAGGDAALEEAIRTARQAGQTRLNICHFKVAGRSQYGSAAHRLDLISEAEKSGLHVSLDLYPYTSAATNLQYLIPEEAFRDFSKSNGPGGRAEALARATEATLAKLHRDGWQDYGFVHIAFSTQKKWVGLTIPQVVGQAQPGDPPSARDQVRWILGHRQSDLQIVADVSDEGDLRRILSWPGAVIGSDSSVHYPGWGRPHPRGEGTFPRIFAEYVRQQRLFSLEEAVHRTTGGTAEVFGIAERGFIRQGYWADLVILDPARVQDRATPEDPWATPLGIVEVIENGVAVAHDGRLTHKFPGLPVCRGKS